MPTRVWGECEAALIAFHLAPALSPPGRSGTRGRTADLRKGIAHALDMVWRNRLERGPGLRCVCRYGLPQGRAGSLGDGVVRGWERDRSHPSQRAGPLSKGPGGADRTEQGFSPPFLLGSDGGTHRFDAGRAGSSRCPRCAAGTRGWGAGSARLATSALGGSSAGISGGADRASASTASTPAAIGAPPQECERAGKAVISQPSRIPRC